MTVESQNYNTVPEKIWDDRLKGFRPLTAAERYARNKTRANGNKNWLIDEKPITKTIQ
jgi:hypothetical protein